MNLIGNNLAKLDIRIAESIIAPKSKEIIICDTFPVCRDRIIHPHVAGRGVIIVDDHREFRTDLGGIDERQAWSEASDIRGDPPVVVAETRNTRGLFLFVVD